MRRVSFGFPCSRFRLGSVHDRNGQSPKPKFTTGFTLVELLVGSAVFLIVALSVYQSYTSIYRTVEASRYKVDAAALANEELEIVRNMPYSDVGVENSIPDGVLAHSQVLNRDGADFTVVTTVRNIDDPFDGTLGGTPNDTSPADYKLVQLDISCEACKNFTPISVATHVAPKNLETASTNGALFIKVFDGNGNPVADANVHVVNDTATSTITIDDVTDQGGMLELVDVPPGTDAYHIVVSKSGYTTDQTYAPGDLGSSTPSHTDATVLLQQVTQTSFSIDKVSTAKITTVTPTCSAVGNIGFTYAGSKVIGTSPDVPKHTVAATTNSGGAYSDSNVEWDTYTFAMTDSSYELLGMNPVNPVTIGPGASQDIQMIVHSKTPQSVLVSVVDSGTGLPVSGASVEITGPDGFDETETTGEGYLRQTDWSGGGGQNDFADETMWSTSDGNVETGEPEGELKLANRLGQYESSGTLTSSTFDVGSSTNYNEISWTPLDEPPSAGADAVKFQLAANDDDLTWVYTGPDGSTSTYYTLSNRTIAPSLSGHRYIRYKAFLSTDDTSVTPNVSDVAFTFTTACTPPGQVIFTNLETGTYTITVTKSGYQDYSIGHSVGSTWSSANISLNPE
ncbi:MAG TPA: prepilin-type N-terminal cleavage/methylation domain-containing protein [Candidatus Paceibacterota bacterium]|nr:prepilin-type N-terminal cleavage/methylation domain-containing protein [Candidatus Paceibacterota bacterium]